MPKAIPLTKRRKTPVTLLFSHPTEKVVPNKKSSSEFHALTDHGLQRLQILIDIINKKIKKSLSSKAFNTGMRFGESCGALIGFFKNKREELSKVCEPALLTAIYFHFPDEETTSTGLLNIYPSEHTKNEFMAGMLFSMIQTIRPSIDRELRVMDDNYLKINKP